MKDRADGMLKITVRAVELGVTDPDVCSSAPSALRFDNNSIAQVIAIDQATCG